MRNRWLCSAAVLLAIACFPEKKAEPQRVATVPSEAEAQKFAAAYIDALYKPNIARLSQLVDWEAVGACDGRPGDALARSWRKAVAAGARNTQTRLAENLVKNIKDGGSVSALRVRTVKGERSAILRILLPDGSFNYFEMPLVRDATASSARATSISMRRANTSRTCSGACSWSARTTSRARSSGSWERRRRTCWWRRLRA
jgi:hypothetical protein